MLGQDDVYRLCGLERCTTRVIVGVLLLLESGCVYHDSGDVFVDAAVLPATIIYEMQNAA